MGVRANALSVFSRVLSSRSVAAAFVAIPLSMLPVLAGAVETDRITVEDPATGAVKFKVTSEGNVTGASFAGDGSALVNVPHWKGSWSAVTAYNKDEVVSYGGSSYIALAQSTNAQPNLFPASWAVFAQQGANGAPGAAGAQGAIGPTGPQGPQGPEGPAETQSTILSKLSIPTQGAALTVQQNSNEAATALKLSVKNASGASNFSVNAKGYTGIGTASPSTPVSIDTTFASDIAMGSPVFLVQGASNRERFELRSLYAPVFQGRQFNGSLASPTATTTDKILFALGGGGYDGTAFTLNKATVIMRASENWSSSAQGTYTTFETTPSGSSAPPTEKMRITGDGNIGIGASAPTQKLEVNGGVRINTVAAKPTCSSTVRGTFWLTQQSAGTMDSLEVCIKDAADAYVWKAVW